MWYPNRPISLDELHLFETAMNFRFAPALRDFLKAYNAGSCRQCNLTTEVKVRQISGILDFSKGGSAWSINKRMRSVLGTKCVVIGTDKNDNFFCVCRDGLKQSFAIWNHITSKIEKCTTEISAVLMTWQVGGERDG